MLAALKISNAATDPGEGATQAVELRQVARRLEHRLEGFAVEIGITVAQAIQARDLRQAEDELAHRRLESHHSSHLGRPSRTVA